ncbi:hypothetical protein [Priestia megaterium]|uniref:hypothetical protein n=1 Tax=Priestia megaterium TaxID=1404 RepID=UPI0018669257|nr:hypothetical protein [Priestia megaterium]MBE2977790.1 hypothetical protein [Priestia megaterium]
MLKLFSRKKNIEENTSHELVEFFKKLSREYTSLETTVNSLIKNEENFQEHLDGSFQLANDLIIFLTRKVNDNYIHMLMIRELNELTFFVDQNRKRIRDKHYSNIEWVIYPQLQTHFNIISRVYLTMLEATKNYEKYGLVFKDEITSIEHHFIKNQDLFPVPYTIDINEKLKIQGPKRIYKIIDNNKYNPNDDAVFIESVLDKDTISMIVGAIQTMFELEIEYEVCGEEKHFIYLLSKYYNAVEISGVNIESSEQEYDVIDIPTVRELSFEYSYEELKNMYFPKSKDFYEEVEKLKPYYLKVLGIEDKL